MYDKNQFADSLCKNLEKCDVWASALTFLRSGKGDCDEVLALSHYSLHKKGIGLYLGYNHQNEGHAVYIYESDNGFYGIISINESEGREAKYRNLHEAALSFSGTKYDYYKFIFLPENDDILLHSYEGIKKKSHTSEKIYFQKKDEDCNC